MNLASYQDGSRDGQLVVVSSDMAQAHYATGIATRLQQVLDDWNFLSPQLEDLARQLDQGRARHAFPFEPGRCLAPLPRGVPWFEAVGEADAGLPRLRCARPDYLAPGELLEMLQDGAAADTPPDGPPTEPDASAPPPADLPPDAPADEAPADASGRSAEGLVAEARLVAVTGDLPRGTPAAPALDGVRLLMLAAPLRWHTVDGQAPDSDAERGIAFAPVAVTPEALGPAWHGGRLAARLELRHNGRRQQPVDLPDDAPHPGWALAALARHAGLRAGTLVAGLPFGRSPLLRPGDALRLELTGRDGQSLFGAIDVAVARAGAAPR